MKAMMLTGIRAMELGEVADPELRAPDDVLIRMGAVGVCGSDVHYFTNGRIGDQVVTYPFMVGHEGAGIVEAVGAAVTRVKPGDRIAIEPAITCGRCDQCRAGRCNTCRHTRFLGCPGQVAGCLSEFIVMPEACCFPVRPDTTLELATISEPLAIGLYALRHSIPMPGARVGVLGMGPIGQTVLRPALYQGARCVYATDRIDARCGYALEAGAGYAGNPGRTDVVHDILQQEPLGLDVVFECCGQQAALDQALQLLKPGGKLMIIGIPSVDRISFDVDFMRRREITVYNVRRQAHCVQAALDLLETGAINGGTLITHRFSFEDAQAAFDLVADYRDGVLKAMIGFPGTR